MQGHGPSSFLLPRLAVIALAAVAAWLAVGHWHPGAPQAPAAPSANSPRWPSELADELSRSAAELVSGYLEQWLAEEDAASTDPEVIQRFLDPTASAHERRLAGWQLATRPDDEARAALLQALRSGTSEMRAAAAEALGRGRFPDALAILRSLLTDVDPVVVKGALSGVAGLGSDAAAGLLKQVLTDPASPPDFRTRSAALLGEMGTAAALQALKTAAGLPLDDDTLAVVMDGLGNYRFRDTAEAFRNLLADPARDGRFKAEATEALARSDQDALPYLLETAGSATDPDIRASAAWAAGANAHTGRIGPELGRLLQSEPDAEVRRRLYESLMLQQNPGGPAVLEPAFGEIEPATRIAGANALATAIRRNQVDSATIDRFHAEQLPELLATALGDEPRNLRYRAVFALVRAGTAEASSALGTIAAQGEHEIAALAARGLASFPHFQNSNP